MKQSSRFLVTSRESVCQPASTPIDPNHKLCGDSGNSINKGTKDLWGGLSIYAIQDLTFLMQ